MNVAIVRTPGGPVDQTVRDLRRLRTDRDYAVAYEDIALGDGYRPPGVWVRGPSEGRNGLPQLCLFPHPYHPLEVIASFRGWGGLIAGGVPDVDALTRMNAARNAGWLSWTETVAGYLFWTPEQFRVVYHLLTPLFTNGGGPDVGDPRRLLYAAAGCRDRAEEAEARSVTPRRGYVPCRVYFWGEEVRGAVRL